MLRNATTRLIAVHLLLVALSTAGVLAFLYWSTNSLIEGEMREVVNAELTGLSEDYQRRGTLGLARAIDRRLASAEERDAVYLLTDAYGGRIAGNLEAWPPTVAPGSGWVELKLYRTDRKRAAPIAAASIRLAGGERLLVGRDAEARTLFGQALRGALLQSLLAALLLSLITGWLLSRFVLSRIRDIARTAGDIMSGDLGRRVPLRGSGDEFDRLSETLNRMLGQIEALVANLRTTTDSLAHDLRSPLTRLRGQLAELAEPALEEERRQALVTRAVTETEGLLRTFASLIEISRAEAGLARADFEPVDLGKLARDAVELYEPAATDRDVTLVLKGSAPAIQGHGQLIAQALSNLLENALRYAPAGSTVTVEVGSGANEASIAVLDHGPGIPEDQRETVLQRFATLDPSRGAHDGGQGTGLGLALVAAVAKMHGGRIALADNAPGLVARLYFPLEQPDSVVS